MSEKEKLECGLIMPISSIDGCSAEHWLDVKTILTEAVETIEDPQFKVRMVSDADEIGVIQKRIVQNVYSSDVVICDVSGKNPNVMFELGMRLAFDKPTVIVKDDKTDYSFDTSIIEHITYPRDLRFGRIVTFKKSLADKLLATHEKAASDPEHSTFLKNFGKFQVANLSEDVVSADKVVLESITELRREVHMLRNGILHRRDHPFPRHSSNELRFKLIRAIEKWASKHECPTNSLLGNQAFYEWAEEMVDAREHFKSRDDYIEFLESLLVKIAA